jgi:hypothetical protein
MGWQEIWVRGWIGAPFRLPDRFYHRSERTILR